MKTEVGIEQDSSVDFDLDLDALVAEGMLIKAALKNKALGRKNKPAEEKALSAAQVVSEMSQWVDKSAFLIFREYSTPCSKHFPTPTSALKREFLGTWIYSEGRRGNGRRLVKSDSGLVPFGLPITTYVAKEKDQSCPECLWEQYSETGADVTIPVDLLEGL